MMSNTLGAPFGGTTRGGHHGFDSLALWLITPPNLMGGGGSCLPSIVIVALGEPGVPVICWAKAHGATDTQRKMLRKFVILLTTRPPGIAGFAAHNSVLKQEGYSHGRKIKA